MRDRSTLGPVASLGPELSSIRTALDELTARVGTLAEEQHRAKVEEVAIELDEVERALRAGIRRLERLLRVVQR